MINDTHVQFLSADQNLKAHTLPDEWLTVESVDIEAQGIAHNHAGKVVFIEGALPGEQVQVDVRRRKNQWEAATARVIQHHNAMRVDPRCPYFGLCGGCAMQHFHPLGQIAIKQRALEDNLWHLAKVTPDLILRPIEGPAWGYRWRARLSVRHVFKKGTVLIGFREKRSSYVADMLSCSVLPDEVSKLLPALRELILSMDGCDRIPQIEVAVGEDVIALALRHLEPLTLEDKKRLIEFGIAHKGKGRSIEWWLQPKGPQTIHLLELDSTKEAQSRLCYRLPEFDVTMPFKPSDFTQVNPFINRVMVHRALSFLDIQPHERIIDWFCGLGNFTLPLSRQARDVLGVEGSTTLVARAQENAKLNGCTNTSFVARNLFEMTGDELKTYGLADKWLLDPPREGALELVKALSDLHAQKMSGDAAAQDLQLPKRIVYVSCNPATLARDAGLLVHQAGYNCSSAGVINMFPHTAHVESIAVFDYGG